MEPTSGSTLDSTLQSQSPATPKPAEAAIASPPAAPQSSHTLSAQEAHRMSRTRFAWEAIVAASVVIAIVTGIWGPFIDWKHLFETNRAALSASIAWLDGAQWKSLTNSARGISDSSRLQVQAELSDSAGLTTYAVEIDGTGKVALLDEGSRTTNADKKHIWNFRAEAPAETILVIAIPKKVTEADLKKLTDALAAAGIPPKNKTGDALLLAGRQIVWADGDWKFAYADGSKAPDTIASAQDAPLQTWADKVKAAFKPIADKGALWNGRTIQVDQ